MPTVTDAIIPDRLQAFERQGFGLFLHWGLYSQLERGEWFWHHHHHPRADYVALQQTFTAANFDARAWCRLAKGAGCRYVVLTTRHHEGFSLYDTRGLNTFDAPHAPAGRDLVAEFSAACEAEGLGKYFYHTTIDWWHPDFAQNWPAYIAYLRQSVEILCTRYGRVDGFWFDGNWARPEANWELDALYGMIRQHQPEAILVNNSSTGALGADDRHPEIDVRTFEQGRPTRAKAGGRYRSGEMCETITSHWGVARHDYSFKSPAEIIDRLVACRSVGANLLLNVAPEADGEIPAYESALLQIVGRWISVCPEAIYNGRPTALLCRAGDAVIQVGSTYYMFVGHLPIAGNTHLHHGDGAGPRTIQGELPVVKKVDWADTGEVLTFTQDVSHGLFTCDATAFPYGDQRIWRIARLETA